MLGMFSNRLILLAQIRYFAILGCLPYYLNINIGSGDCWEQISWRMATEFLLVERQRGLIHQTRHLLCIQCEHISQKMGMIVRIVSVANERILIQRLSNIQLKNNFIQGMLQLQALQDPGAQVMCHQDIKYFVSISQCCSPNSFILNRNLPSNKIHLAQMELKAKDSGERIEISLCSALIESLSGRRSLEKEKSQGVRGGSLPKMGKF